MRSVIWCLRWWLLPSPNQVLGDAAAFIVSSVVASWAQERHHVGLEVSAYAFSLVFLVPVVVAGFWLLIRRFFVDPLRGYLVRRATGEEIYGTAVTRQRSAIATEYGNGTDTQ